MRERTSPDARYWVTETSTLYDAPDVVTGSHRIYRKYGRRHTHFLGDAQATLRASPDSAIGRLGFGDTLERISNPVWVKHCRVTYRVNWLC